MIEVSATQPWYLLFTRDARAPGRIHRIMVSTVQRLFVCGSGMQPRKLKASASTLGVLGTRTLLPFSFLATQRYIWIYMIWYGAPINQSRINSAVVGRSNQRMIYDEESWSGGDGKTSPCDLGPSFCETVSVWLTDPGIQAVITILRVRWLHRSLVLISLVLLSNGDPRRASQIIISHKEFWIAT